MHKYECVPFGMKKYKSRSGKEEKINNKEKKCHR